MFQQYAAPEDNGKFEERLRPYVSQVLMVMFFLIPSSVWFQGNGKAKSLAFD